MVTDAFGTLLQEISAELKIDKMAAGEKNSCIVHYPDDLKLQIEADPTQTDLLLIIEIGSLPNGRYREVYFKEALKANGLFPSPVGIFAYSHKADKLILYEKMTLKGLSGNRVVEVLTPLLEKARQWIEWFKRGDFPVAKQNASSSGIFGLH